MLVDTLFALASEIGLQTDPQNASAFGTYSGFGVSVKAIEGKNCFFVNIWARKGALANATPEEFLTEYSKRPGNDYIKAFKPAQYGVDVILLGDADSTVVSTRIMTFLEDITDFLQLNYYSNACAKCGSSIGLSICNTPQGNVQLCSICSQKENDTASASAVSMGVFPQAQQPAPAPAAVQPQPVYPQPMAMPQPAYQQPVQNTYTQPAQDISYQQSVQNTYTQPAQDISYQQPVQNTYTQPAQDISYQQPVQNTYTQPAQDIGYQQPVQNTYAQPAQDISYQQQGAYMQQPMGGVILEPAASVAELGSQDGMEAINPAEMPESTGYSTAESLAELTPQRFNNTPMTDYGNTPVPMPGDFRAEPEYGSSAAAYDPMAVPSYAYVPEKSNPLMGILGALLFSFIACIIWVVIGMTGHVSYLGGLAMGFCVVTGYKLLGKRFDVFGFICCIIVILLAVLGCNIFIEVLTLYNEPGAEEILKMLGYNSFADTFFHFFDLANLMDNALSSIAPGADSVMGTFVRNLLIGYAFAGVGFLVVAIPQYKSRRI